MSREALPLHTQDKDTDSTGHGNAIRLSNTPSIEIITGQKALVMKGNRHTCTLAGS